MRLVYSARAERNLESLSDWIAIYNKPRAASFVIELRNVCRTLLDCPRGYPFAPEFGAGIRKRTHGNYLILYRVGDAVTIVAIRQAARRRR